MQRLLRQGGSGLVTLPKDGLERDGLLDENGDPREGQSMMVDRLGERCYLVRAVDGDVPEVSECPEVRRLAAEMMLDRETTLQPAD